ncbi:hypothetical protein L202_02613 [Cryptococcus amylolentus CBS 6039]|uniref:Uncharacterized protein n=1 Tax=Cryptococcus amylolentus CBS 6039 TaxID=1295533 RepID=A0A1E3HVK7_9TREE|nr:hypothetical protein L202_02613 [Cryptococcus amylolentus CBS 6039]ODN80353.1 hypothetical protein L202_02613 [Cryptococcus amylolentus CBS 6039]
MTSLDIPYSSFQRLEPVHYLILDHLFTLAPATSLRLSKYHYERLLPRAYTCISLEHAASHRLISLFYDYKDGVVDHVFPHPTLRPLSLYTSKLNFLDAETIMDLSWVIHVPYLAKIQTIQFFWRCLDKEILWVLELMLGTSTNIHRVVVCYTAEDVRMGSPTEVPDRKEWQSQPLVKALDFLKYCDVGRTLRVIIDLGFVSHCLSSGIVRLMGDELASIVGSVSLRRSGRLPLKLFFKYEGDVDLVEELRGHIENRQRYLQADVSDIEEARLASQIGGYWRESVELRRIGGREMEELLS